MVFKRRNPKTWWAAFRDLIYPRTGWRRAASYVLLRLRRLPDSPHKIALGISAGVFICFTPLFGIHMISAVALAALLRANLIAALLGTFFGTPPTFVVIATINYQLGTWMLGTDALTDEGASVLNLFAHAISDLWHNFRALFGAATADWTELWQFFDQVFVPYLVGGIIPGIITSFAIYTLTRPIIETYQNRRKGRLIAKLKEIRQKKKDASGP